MAACWYPNMDTINAKTGCPFDPEAFTPLVIGETLAIENEGAASRQFGKVAVIFFNSDIYGGADLVVTPTVTATLPESGAQLDAIPTSITIPPQQFSIIGPFGLHHQNEDDEVEFETEGEEGAYYAIYTR